LLQPGDTTLGMQAKILRVLQEREVMRVGGTEAIKVDVRIVAATNKNLEQLLKEGKFREDLYYRLKVIPIVCPPLRGRREDIKELAEHFVRKAALASGREVRGFTDEALEALETYHWPGNIRQLEWAMERGVLLGETNHVELRDLPPEIVEREAEAVPAAGAGTFISNAPDGTAAAPALAEGGPKPIISEGSWEEHEKAKIMEALDRTNGNITRAAQLLGMTFRTLQYRLEKFGIKRA